MNWLVNIFVGTTVAVLTAAVLTICYFIFKLFGWYVVLFGAIASFIYGVYKAKNKK